MKTKLLIVGSINQDVVVTSKEIPKPGQTVVGNELFYFPGGKGLNQGVSAHKLGRNSTFFGKVGDDVFGTNMSSFINKLGMDARVEKVDNMTTGTAFICIDEKGENSITIVKGVNNNFSNEDLDILDNFDKDDFLLLQNEINIDYNHRLIERAFKKGLKVFLNPAPSYSVPKDVIDNCYCLIVNEHELVETFGISELNLDSETEIKETLIKVSKEFSTNIVLTIGSRGVRAIYENQYINVAGLSVKVVDTTGAGDCFCGALATFLSEGMEINESIELSNIAASISVQGLGANSSYPTREEINTAD